MYNCHENENQKVYVCFDGDGYDVVGVYTSKAEAQRHMIDAYIAELKQEKQSGEELNFDRLTFDLQSMLNGCVECFFYIEEHEVRTKFEVDTF